MTEISETVSPNKPLSFELYMPGIKVCLAYLVNLDYLSGSPPCSVPPSDTTKTSWLTLPGN